MASKQPEESAWSDTNRDLKFEAGDVQANVSCLDRFFLRGKRGIERWHLILVSPVSPKPALYKRRALYLPPHVAKEAYEKRQSEVRTAEQKLEDAKKLLETLESKKDSYAHTVVECRERLAFVQKEVQRTTAEIEALEVCFCEATPVLCVDVNLESIAHPNSEQPTPQHAHAGPPRAHCQHDRGQTSVSIR